MAYLVDAQVLWLHQVAVLVKGLLLEEESDVSRALQEVVVCQLGLRQREGFHAVHVWALANLLIDTLGIYLCLTTIAHDDHVSFTTAVAHARV